ncbi:unnamed protein product, partial [Clonostachys rhizophaga]
QQSDNNQSRTRELGGASGLPGGLLGKAVKATFCTQRYLLDLVRGYLLNTNYPNFTLYRTRNYKTNCPKRHPIIHTNFLKLLSKQLKQTLNSGIKSLDITSSHGALFKISLLTYRYTFISKGTVEAFISDLKHEELIYKQLKKVQGTHIPVFLGTTNLRNLSRTYYYNLRINIGGISLRDINTKDINKAFITGRAIQSIKAIHQEGVVHIDTRRENILFNPETREVITINFKRSQLLSPPRHQLTALQPNKRQRIQDTSGKVKAVSRPHSIKS